MLLIQEFLVEVNRAESSPLIIKPEAYIFSICYESDIGLPEYVIKLYIVIS